MNRRDLTLAMLVSSGGRSYTPVQIQKAMFLVTKNMGVLVTDGPNFNFFPYDYGPFDSDLYAEVDTLRNAGDAIVAPFGGGRWSTYAASDAGLERGAQILDTMRPDARLYLEQVSNWVRAQPFSSLVQPVYQFYPDV